MPTSDLPPYEYRLTVSPDEIDEMNHVGNLVYLRWTLKAANAHSSAVGWTTHRYRELGQGWIVRSHEITYRRPALAGDEILIRTWVDNFEKVSSIRQYRIHRASDNSLLANAATNWVFVDLETLRMQPIPEEIQIAFGFQPANR